MEVVVTNTIIILAMQPNTMNTCRLYALRVTFDAKMPVVSLQALYVQEIQAENFLNGVRLMSETTEISWCDSTHNEWYGCTKVSPACDHCYAEQWARRSGLVGWGPTQDRRLSSAANRAKPLKWEREAAAFMAENGRRRRVFCASLADVFDNAVPTLWRAELWALIEATPNLDWLLLTKRPQNMAAMLPHNWGAGWSNVWLGVTAENQTEANRRIPVLLQTPAAVRFLSVEPMLGPVVMEQWQDEERVWRYLYGRIDVTAQHVAVPPERTAKIDWVIAGGETGPGARPTNEEWLRSLRDQCATAGVPFFLKHRGEWVPEFHDAFPNGRDAKPERMSEAFVQYCDRNGNPSPPAPSEDYTGSYYYRAGKAAAGRLLDGREHNEYPRTER